MVTKEQLEKLSKDELILYNELIEKNIKDVAYYACIEVQRNKRLDKFANEKLMKVIELKRQLSCFIGYKS